MIGIVSRLFFLQVKENKKYLTLSDKNRIREWKLAPVRGEFHDYFGNIIAGNFEAYQLHVIPEQVEDFRYVIYRLKDLLELSDKEFKKVFCQNLNFSLKMHSTMTKVMLTHKDIHSESCVSISKM